MKVRNALQYALISLRYYPTLVVKEHVLLHKVKSTQTEERLDNRGLISMKSDLTFSLIFDDIIN